MAESPKMIYNSEKEVMVETGIRSGVGPRIVIIGAGFCGIVMAVNLKRAGLTNFVVYERAAGHSAAPSLSAA
jgi:NADPH-dependent 2,4-dienoyl-CoA reductase/sulfur reductase-like enzyme